MRVKSDTTWRLVILLGEPKGAALPLTGDSVTVGREGDNIIELDDTLVSRHHAVLVRNGAGYILRDLGSRNGSFVNDHPAKDTPLKPGDHIRFGETEFRYESTPVTRSLEVEPPLELESRLVELTRENEELADELDKVQREAAEAHQRFAEQVAEEMKKIRRDQAGDLVQHDSSSPAAKDEQPKRFRKGRLGLSWLALAILCVTALAVALWRSRH
jgi:FHA domain-containing protein